MNWYYGILIWFLVVAIIIKGMYISNTEIVLGKERQCVHWVVAVLVILPLIVWASQRLAGFGDTAVYINSFEEMPTSLAELQKYIESINKDKGFYAFSALIKIVFGNNVKVYFFVLALFQGLCLSSMYRKYSSDYVLAIFIFVTSMDYFSYMQNGVRQFTAVAILLFATPFLVEKKYGRYLAFVLIASLMHQSALLMIPIAIIAQGKAWNKRTILMLILALFAVAFVGRFTNILDRMLAETQYTNVVSDWQEWNDDGTNPLRVLVFSMPMILSIIGFKYIKSENDPIINMATNMSIVSAGLYIISMVTSGIFIGRLPIYASMYSMGVLLPWEIDHIFTESSAKLVKFFMIICFCIFYYYQLHYAWSVI